MMFSQLPLSTIKSNTFPPIVHLVRNNWCRWVFASCFGANIIRLIT
uniref:Uncharacterized protein n=1 Tax=Rhizophora mucronata TaxID=61149 RepID=A0A2P2PCJ5_RHIMU